MSTAKNIILSITIGLIGGFLSSYLPGVNPTSSFIIGLLFLIIGMLILEVVEISESLSKIERLNSILTNIIHDMFLGDSPFSDFYNLTMFSSVRKGIERTGITLSKEKSPEKLPSFWHNSLIHFGNTFFATSFTEPKEGWMLAYTKNIALNIQEAKIKQGKKIKRVFIVETKGELNQITPVLEEQREKGIDVKYIFYNQIKQHPMMSKTKLESLDFAIIDDEFLLLTILNGKREIVSAKLIRNKMLCEKYNHFYQILFDEAKVVA